MIKDALDHVWEFLSEFFKKEEVWILLLFVGLGVWIIYAFFDAIWAIIRNFFVYAWPIILFFLILPLLSSLWLFVRQYQFKEAIKFTLFELRMPREVKKSPQAMEQVLAGIHSMRNSAGDVSEKYWEGEVTYWWSLEIVSFGGEVHFFVRTPKGRAQLLRAAFFSYYPDVEIEEVEDYIEKFPRTMEEMNEQGLDMWGSDMLLAKESAYPIRTYDLFEHEAEEKQFDPISSFLEILGALKKDETVGMQFIIAPASPKWAEKFEDVVEELKTPKTFKVGVDEETGGREVPLPHTDVHKEVLAAVEENLSKPAFDTLIRFAYFSPKEGFKDTFPRRGLTGAFKQYSAANLNDFRANYPTQTRTRIWNKPHIFPKTRLWYRKQRMLLWYRKREVPPETWMGRFVTSYLFNWNFGAKRFLMNTKCLATLFHPPTAVVLTAPHIKRVESRRAGPPAGLAIFGEEGEIERFK
jgi:hypothetical protein